MGNNARLRAKLQEATPTARIHARRLHARHSLCCKAATPAWLSASDSEPSFSLIRSRLTAPHPFGARGLRHTSSRPYSRRASSSLVIRYSSLILICLLFKCVSPDRPLRRWGVLFRVGRVSVMTLCFYGKSFFRYRRAAGISAEAQGMRRERLRALCARQAWASRACVGIRSAFYYLLDNGGCLG